MAKKKVERLPDLYEYKITFQLQERSSQSVRHYLAHNARDALGMFAYSAVKLLFKRKTYATHQFLLAREFVKFHDSSAASSKFAAEDDQPTEGKGPKARQEREKTGMLEDLQSLIDEMTQQINLVKFEEFNRWSGRWYALRLPLEEIKEGEEQ